MAITYHWNTYNVDVYPTKTDANDVTETDVIWHVNWQLIATDGSRNHAAGDPIRGVHFGETDLDISDFTGFIAFDSVTRSNVQGWVEADLGADKIAAMKTALNADIALQITPITVNRHIGA